MVPYDDYPPGTFRHPEVISWLIEKGAPLDVPDIADHTALHHSSMHNRIPVLTVALLKGGANPNALNRWGEVPLHGAMAHGQEEAVLALLSFNADPTIKGATHGIAPIDNLKWYTPAIQKAVLEWKRKQEGVIAPLEDRKKCVVCGREERQTRVCTRCRTVQYCGSKCQGKSHKEFGLLLIILR